MSQGVLSFIGGAVFGAVALFLALGSSTPGPYRSPAVTYTQLLTQVEDGKIARATFAGARVIAEGSNRQKTETLLPSTSVIPQLVDRMTAKGIEINAAPEEHGTTVLSLFLAWLPLLVTYVLFFWGLWITVARPVRDLIRRIDVLVQRVALRT